VSRSTRIVHEAPVADPQSSHPAKAEPSAAAALSVSVEPAGAEAVQSMGAPV
jgi:hypothetical protein